MATKLLYLEDFDVVSSKGVAVTVEAIEDNRTAVVLDQTCFYPRGGGQDWDQGVIQSINGVYRVEEVRLDETGAVRHVGHFESGTLAAGDTVTCRVDAERRIVNTRLHSAGHVIDMAMYSLAPEWVPARGGHYPHMSFVEYSVPPDTVPDEQFKQTLQGKIEELLQSTYKNQLLFIPKEEMATYCRHVPDNLPNNKPARIVLYRDDFGIPCGGTHVRRLTDIGTVSITKIKVKQGRAKVSYAVAGIN